MPCTGLLLFHPATICKLFDKLVLPILSYSCEVCAVNLKVVAKAEPVLRQFLKQLLGVEKSTANQIVHAELTYALLTAGLHNQVCAQQNSQLDKLALIDGSWDSHPPPDELTITMLARILSRFLATQEGLWYPLHHMNAKYQVNVTKMNRWSTKHALGKVTS